MASTLPVRRLISNIGGRVKSSVSQNARTFSVSSQRRTDGVFRELTAQRVQKPWIEALRDQQSSVNATTTHTDVPQTPKDRDLTPKKMNDSHYSVVRSRLATSITFAG
jgi:acyl-coenzyme A thioesterase 9